MLTDVDRFAAQQAGVQIIQNQGSASIGFNERPLDCRQLIRAAEVALDVADQTVEYPRRVGAAVERAGGSAIAAAWPDAGASPNSWGVEN